MRRRGPSPSWSDRSEREPLLVQLPLREPRVEQRLPHRMGEARGPHRYTSRCARPGTARSRAALDRRPEHRRGSVDDRFREGNVWICATVAREHGSRLWLPSVVAECLTARTHRFPTVLAQVRLSRGAETGGTTNRGDTVTEPAPGVHRRTSTSVGPATAVPRRSLDVVVRRPGGGA